MIEFLIKIYVVIATAIAVLFTVIGLPPVAKEINKNEAYKDIVKWLYGKGKNITWIIIFCNIFIFSCIVLIMLFNLGSKIFEQDDKKIYMFFLNLIPLVFISVLLYFSIMYEKENVSMFVDIEVVEAEASIAEKITKEKVEVEKNFWTENAGSTMCIIFITFYVLTLFFLLILNDVIYKNITYYQKYKIKEESVSEFEEKLKENKKLNSFKLTLLYYYLGLVVGSLILIFSAFFGDQSSNAYNYIFCNTYVGSTQKSGSSAAGSSSGGGSSTGSGSGGSY